MPKWVTLDEIKDSRDPDEKYGTSSPMVTYEENSQPTFVKKSSRWGHFAGLTSTAKWFHKVK